MDVSFGQIHYRFAGDVSKPLLVLLHQTPSDSAMYETLMADLCGDFRLVAPDTPGMGMSDPLPGSISIDSCADAIVEFIEQIGTTHCLLFGHHTGAAIAADIASRYPQLIAALAMSGPTLLDKELKAGLLAYAPSTPMNPDGSHLLKMWQRMREKDSEAPLAIAERETINGLRTGKNYSAMYAAVAEQDFALRVASIQCPVLVFAGTGDPLYSRLGATYDLLERGEKATIEGAKTFVCETHSEEVAAHLRDFFPGAEK